MLSFKSIEVEVTEHCDDVAAAVPAEAVKAVVYSS